MVNNEERKQRVPLLLSLTSLLRLGLDPDSLPDTRVGTVTADNDAGLNCGGLPCVGVLDDRDDDGLAVTSGLNTSTRDSLLRAFLLTSVHDTHVHPLRRSTCGSLRTRASTMSSKSGCEMLCNISGEASRTSSDMRSYGRCPTASPLRLVQKRTHRASSRQAGCARISSIEIPN